MFIPLISLKTPAAEDHFPVAENQDHVAFIAAFFDTYGHDLPRQWLWDLLKAALSSEQSAGWTGSRRADYMSFCEQLAALIAAATSLIHPHANGHTLPSGGFSRQPDTP